MRTYKKRVGRRSLNCVFLVGEVVDLGITPDDDPFLIRARLKMRSHALSTSFVYLDIFGRKANAETMNLLCQKGNIVYVEGEFRNRFASENRNCPYVTVTHIECLYWHKDVDTPSVNIIELLDTLDPIGYVQNEEEDEWEK